jgi:F-type H+-transporting ATPase subunit delta
MGIVERRYALALYEAALDKDRVSKVQSDLSDFLEAERKVPELKAVLDDPELDSASKVALLDDLLAGSEGLVSNFLRLLAEKERITALEEIVHEFEALVAAAERRLRVTVTTAKELSEEETSALVSRIEAQVGHPVEARRRVDPSLIGGVVVQAGSLRLDASIRGRIEKLRTELVETRS